MYNNILFNSINNINIITIYNDYIIDPFLSD